MILHPNYWELSRDIGAQMEASASNEYFLYYQEFIKNFLNYTIYWAIFLFVVTKSETATLRMLLMVRSLQFIMHLPILRVVLPANVLLLIKVLIPAFGFDMMEYFDFWDK